MRITALSKNLLLIFVCFSLALPLFADVSYAKNYNATKKVTVKKVSSKKHATKKMAVKKTADENREVWLKRAQGSEIFTGKASWYGKDFHNKKTASGVTYDMHTFTAAHRTLPLGTVVNVTDQNNGKSVMVTINDRGPYIKGRIIDLSYAAAEKIGLQEKGVSKVAVEVISDANGKPLKNDRAYFVQYESENGKKRVGPFDAFADASAMGEALRTAHKKVDVVLEKITGK